MKSDLRAVVTGSFDPITIGHMDIIKRASSIFPSVYVVMFINEEKKYMFTEEQRLDFIKKACAPYKNVTVDFSRGMVVDYVRENNISVIIRGIRADGDVAYEKKMAEYNRTNSGVETLLLPANPCHESISSTLVRNAIINKNMDALSNLLPKEILQDFVI